MFRKSRKQSLRFLILASVLAILLLPMQCYAESYVGVEVIIETDAEGAKPYRTIEMAKNDLFETVENQVGEEFAFVHRYIYYWESGRGFSRISGWTTQNYVNAGDTVVTMETTGDPIALHELELELKRLQNGYADRVDIFKKQIAAQEKLVKLSSGKQGQIEALVLKKMQSEYQQYLFAYEQQSADLEQQIADCRSQNSLNEIKAPCSGYLFIPDYLNHQAGNYVLDGEPLFCIALSNEYVVTVNSEKPFGVQSADKESFVVSDATHFSDYALKWQKGTSHVRVTKPLDAESMERICGTVTGVTWKPQTDFSYLVASDQCAVSYSIVYREGDDQSVGALLVGAGNVIGLNPEIYDSKYRYYVNVLEDGIRKKRFVTIGKISLTNKQVALLGGVQEGDLIAIV